MDASFGQDSRFEHFFNSIHRMVTVALSEPHLAKAALPNWLEEVKVLSFERLEIRTVIIKA